MSEPKRGESVPKQGEPMSMSMDDRDYLSPAAREAFHLLNAGLKAHYRGYGDTKTAARERAARQAGVTPTQAERLWKTWRTMKYPNGDVYRGLRNTYGHLCLWVENKADALEAARLGTKVGNYAVDASGPATAEGTRTGAVEAPKGE